jgi:hypothetical protein
MDISSILLAAFLAFLALIAFLFFFQRIRWRRRRRLGKKHLGFYPSTAVLALALQSLQRLPQPDVQSTLLEKLEEAVDEDDEAGPDDPTADFKRQLKRIRKGETVGDLKLRLPTKTCQPPNPRIPSQDEANPLA